MHTLRIWTEKLNLPSLNLSNLSEALLDRAGDIFTIVRLGSFFKAIRLELNNVSVLAAKVEMCSEPKAFGGAPAPASPTRGQGRWAGSKRPGRQREQNYCSPMAMLGKIKIKAKQQEDYTSRTLQM
jgi:hypothetical protein